MNEFMNSLVDSSVQCWGCPVFDRLFQIVSDAAGAVYNQFVIFCAIIFCVLFAFFVINAVWKNIKGGVGDPWYQKSVKPVVINSLVSLTFLSMGVYLPRFVTTITFIFAIIIVNVLEKITPAQLPEKINNSEKEEVQND